jgi:hypothetical protein
MTSQTQFREREDDREKVGDEQDMKNTGLMQGNI